MAGRKSDFTLPTNTLDELFSSQEERDEAKLSKIRDIPLEEIDDFPDHPFQVREDEDKVVYTSHDYFRGCMFKRNRHLVNGSSVCIAYLTQEKGGTAYTVNYARQNNVQVINLAAQ